MKTKCCLILLLTGLNFVSMAQQTRYALVIGAQNYTSLPPLHNSINDAKAMATTLKAKGFQVETIYDPKTKKEIKEGVTRYYNEMSNKVGAIGLIFYAGHGMQLNGENYIIPINAALDTPADLDDECVKTNSFVTILQSTSKSLNILLLDACRNLPSFSRGSEQGLTKIDPPIGTIVVFAAQAGKTASDGNGTNGLFTANLIKVINEPNITVSDVFKKVRTQVYLESKEMQLPSLEDNSIGGDFYFTKGEGAATAPAVILPSTGVEKGTKKKEVKNVEDTKIASENLNDNGEKSNAKTVAIGSQIWAAENLNVSNFSNGDEIPEAMTDKDWLRAAKKGRPAWCYLYNDPTNKRFGRLYNWYAVNDPRGLCPAGSHVPSDDDWNILAEHVGNDKQSLKSKTGWGQRYNGDNSTGLSLSPEGGQRSISFTDTHSDFSQRDDWAYFWTSTETHSDTSCAICRANSDSRITTLKGTGVPVRCIKD